MAETRASSPPYPHGAVGVGTRLGEFEVKRVLGVGGFGIVYLAFDHLLEREVALKEYMPASLVERSDELQVTLISQAHADTFALGLRSFVNEARLLARFDHPSLVKVHRFWEANGTAYMAMALYKGRTARDVRTQMTERPDEAWVRRLLEPLLGAIEKLHSEDVYHRDIAPDNILIEADGRPVLLDFGAARRVITDRSQALTAILKPSYAPIEQYADVSGMKQGPWTDIYALGATVHYLLMGKPPPPAPGRSIQDTMKPLATQDLPGFSPSFLGLVDWMLAPLPAERPQSVAAVRDVLTGRAQLPSREALSAFERTAVLPGAGRLPPEDSEDATIVMPRPLTGRPPPAAAAGVPDDATIIQPYSPPPPAPGQTAQRRPPPLAAAAAATAAPTPPAAAAPTPPATAATPRAFKAAPSKGSTQPPPYVGNRRMPLVLGALAAVIVLAAGGWWWGQQRPATGPAAALPGPTTAAPAATQEPPAGAPLATAQPTAVSPVPPPAAQAASAVLPGVTATATAPRVAESRPATATPAPVRAEATPPRAALRSSAQPADSTPTAAPPSPARRQEATAPPGSGQTATGAAPRSTPATTPATTSRPTPAAAEASPRPAPTPAPAEPVAEPRPASPSERCAKELPLVRLICVDLVCNRSEFKQHPECLTLRAEQAKKRMLEGQ